MRGTYSVLDVAAMQRRVRKEIWPGIWDWTGKRSREDQAEYYKHRTKVEDAARKQLQGMRVFVASLGHDRRLLARVESAIMRNLDKLPAPHCHTPAGHMSLSGRRESERPITLHIKCSVTIHGLTSRLEI